LYALWYKSQQMRSRLPVLVAGSVLASCTTFTDKDVAVICETAAVVNADASVPNGRKVVRWFELLPADQLSGAAKKEVRFLGTIGDPTYELLEQAVRVDIEGWSCLPLKQLWADSAEANRLP